MNSSTVQIFVCSLVKDCNYHLVPNLLLCNETKAGFIYNCKK